MFTDFSLFFLLSLPLPLLCPQASSCPEWRSQGPQLCLTTPRRQLTWTHVLFQLRCLEGSVPVTSAEDQGATLGCTNPRQALQTLLPSDPAARLPTLNSYSTARIKPWKSSMSHLPQNNNFKVASRGSWLRSHTEMTDHKEEIGTIWISQSAKQTELQHRGWDEETWGLCVWPRAWAWWPPARAELPGLSFPPTTPKNSARGARRAGLPCRELCEQRCFG